MKKGWVVVPTPDNNVHVVPLSLVDEWARGKRSLWEGFHDGEFTMVIRGILDSWLQNLPGTIVKEHIKEREKEETEEVDRLIESGVM